MLSSPFTGIKLVADPWMFDRVQFRFPRSKKKRIRKKWAKDQKNYKNVPWDKVYKIGDTFIMHPTLLDQVRKACDDQTYHRLR